MDHLLGMGTHTFVRLHFIVRFLVFSITLGLRVLTLSLNFSSRASTLIVVSAVPHHSGPPFLGDRDLWLVMVLRGSDP